MAVLADLYDSLKYSSTSISKVVLIGFFIFLIDIIDRMSWVGPYEEIAEYIMIIATFILGFLVAGYLFRIIKETVHGSKKLPKFDKLYE